MKKSFRVNFEVEFVGDHTGEMITVRGDQDLEEVKDVFAEDVMIEDYLRNRIDIRFSHKNTVLSYMEEFTVRVDDVDTEEEAVERAEEEARRHFDYREDSTEFDIDCYFKVKAIEVVDPSIKDSFMKAGLDEIIDDIVLKGYKKNLAYNIDVDFYNEASFIIEVKSGATGKRWYSDVYQYKIDYERHKDGAIVLGDRVSLDYIKTNIERYVEELEELGWE